MHDASAENHRLNDKSAWGYICEHIASDRMMIKTWSCVWKVNIRLGKRRQTGIAESFVKQDWPRFIIDIRSLFLMLLVVEGLDG